MAIRSPRGGRGARCASARLGLVITVLLALACMRPQPTPLAQEPAPTTAAGSRAAPAQAATAPLALRVAYVSPSAVMAPLWMAAESGAFAHHGIQVAVLHIPANTAVAALLAGEVDVLQISGPAVLAAALQGADLVFVAGALDRMVFSVHAAADVRSGADLRGRLFGSDRPGTPVAYATEVALARLGLSPGEVELLPIGSSDRLLAALLSGQLAATVLTPPASFEAEAAGYPLLVDLYDVPYQNIGLAVRRSRLPALEPALLALLHGYQEGIDRYAADPAFARAVLAKYSGETDPALLERTYDFYRAAGFTRDLHVSAEGLANILGFLARTVPAAAQARPTDFVEPRYLQQLQ
jgi:NitT/TauT family transport system substrate-binding protein